MPSLETGTMPALFNVVNISRDTASHTVRPPPRQDEDLQGLASRRRQLRASRVRADGKLHGPVPRVLHTPHHALRTVARRHLQDGRSGRPDGSRRPASQVGLALSRRPQLVGSLSMSQPVFKRSVINNQNNYQIIINKPFLSSSSSSISLSQSSSSPTPHRNHSHHQHQ